MDSLKGFCYCNEVRFSVDQATEPYTAVYCHCDSCRRAHAAPLYHVVYIPKKDFTITQGNVSYFQKPGSQVTRGFCSRCGSRVSNTLSHREDWLGFFPNLLEPELQGDQLPPKFCPSLHYHSNEAVLRLDKNLEEGVPLHVE